MYLQPTFSVSIKADKISLGSTLLFENINFTLEETEWTCLLGPSGVGKTSLLRIIAGLVPDGNNMSIRCSDHNPINGRISYMAQDDLLLPWLNILDNVLIGYRLRSEKADKSKAKNLIEMVGLSENVYDLPYKLSGGMRQRVVIALALCADPDILIADEPTTALDVSIQSQILALLQKLKADRNLAVILITHDMAVISEVADRVVVLKDGRIVEMGAPAAVLGTPSQTYTKSLVSSVPPTDRRIDRFPIMGAEQNHAADPQLIQYLRTNPIFAQPLSLV